MEVEASKHYTWRDELNAKHLRRRDSLYVHMYDSAKQITYNIF